MDFPYFEVSSMTSESLRSSIWFTRTSPCPSTAPVAPSHHLQPGTSRARAPQRRCGVWRGRALWWHWWGLRDWMLHWEWVQVGKIWRKFKPSWGVRTQVLSIFLPDTIYTIHWMERSWGTWPWTSQILWWELRVWEFWRGFRFTAYVELFVGRITREHSPKDWMSLFNSSASSPKWNVLPSGKQPHNYGKSPCYWWVNQLFRLGHFQ